MSRDDRLPIAALEQEFACALGRGPVVLTAPTGSGKSTLVPRWCARAGRVLVVEPRRVACRSLAQWVAQLEQTPLGGRVGYAVRGESRRSPDTELLFATPGVVLRMMASGDLHQVDTLVLDEFHERSLDVDLILALAAARFRGGLVVMSATLEGERVATHLSGTHLRGEGRLFPVECRYLAGRTVLPDVRGVEDRVLGALEATADLPGDVLVFLPGKAEIARVLHALSSRSDLDVLGLHGGMSLPEQSRVFSPPGERRRVVVATNVAETSLTLPRIGVVLDSGLVRRTRYHHGRGYLTLAPIARDSADQRAGRAGRTSPGVCVRLWAERAPLEVRTPPEIHRESLVPFVLAAAACGEADLELPFLDPPREYAVADAREELVLLGAVDAEARITSRGRAIFGLPLDVHLGRLLVEAEGSGALGDAIDLVAALSSGRRLFRQRTPDDLRECECDAVASILAVRQGEPSRHGLDRFVLAEVRAVSRRLRQAWGLPPHEHAGVDRHRLARTVLAAWPRCAHVARRRRGKVAWSNGGTEVGLARESAVDEQEVDAIAVLESRALGRSRLEQQVLVTAAMPLPLAWLLQAGLGRDRLATSVVTDGAVLSRIERTYAGRVLEVREEEPTGSLAREAIRDLFLQGRVFPEALARTRERLEAAALHARLEGRPIPTTDPVAWALSRLEILGVECGSDLALLAPADLTAPDLPPEVRHRLDREFPRTLSIGDATYRIEYDVGRREATFHKIRGQRKHLPPIQFLPSLPGWRIKVKDKNVVRVVRE